MNSPKRSTTHPLAADQELPMAEELNRIAMLAMSSGNHFAQLQNETADSVIAEVMLRQTEILAKAEEPVLVQWSSLGQSSLQRNIEIARAWWEVTTRTQAAMLAAIQECLGKPVMAAQAAQQGKRFRERRFQNEVIPFPDRRLAA